MFVQGYNYGLEEYGDPERALHLGWASVQRHFHQVGQHWEPNAAEPHHEPPAPTHGDADADVVARLKRLHNR